MAQYKRERSHYSNCSNCVSDSRGSEGTVDSSEVHEALDTTPGFYFDPAKRKYFGISSLPPSLQEECFYDVQDRSVVRGSCLLLRKFYVRGTSNVYEKKKKPALAIPDGRRNFCAALWRSRMTGTPLRTPLAFPPSLLWGLRFVESRQPHERVVRIRSVDFQSFDRNDVFVRVRTDGQGRVLTSDSFQGTLLDIGFAYPGSAYREGVFYVATSMNVHVHGLPSLALQSSEPIDCMTLMKGTCGYFFSFRGILQTRLESADMQMQCRLKGSPTALCALQDGDHVVIAACSQGKGGGALLRIIDRRDPRTWRPSQDGPGVAPPYHRGVIRRLRAVPPRDCLVLSRSTDGAMCLYDIRRGKSPVRHYLEGSGVEVYEELSAFSENVDKGLVAAGVRDPLRVLWFDLFGGDVVHSMELPGTYATMQDIDIASLTDANLSRPLSVYMCVDGQLLSST